MGSYVVMSKDLMGELLKSFPERVDRGLSFPATEWYLETVLKGRKIGGWFPAETMGGYELEDNYHRLVPSYVFGKALGRAVIDRDKGMVKRPLDWWSRSEREALIDNLIGGNRWEMTRKLYEDE